MPFENCSYGDWQRLNDIGNLIARTNAHSLNTGHNEAVVHGLQVLHIHETIDGQKRLSRHKVRLIDHFAT